MTGCSSSGPEEEEPDCEEEEEEDEDSGTLEDGDVSAELVDEGADVGVDASLLDDDDDEPESGPPNASLTLSMNPWFAYAWVASHIITPPKLSNFFEYSMTSASFDAGI